MNAPVAAKDVEDAAVQSVLRKLAIVWTEFEGALESTELIRRLNRGQLRLEDYQAFLINLRQQVVDGACWISRAASNISEDHFDLRSTLISHAATEHRDYRMLEENFVVTGGSRDVIRSAPKNPGSEALSAWMFHTASKPDPFEMIGAMFIIEGLGSTKAAGWGRAVADQLGLETGAVSFLLYHGENDADHMQEFEAMLRMLPLDAELEERIVTCARVTGRLYAMQIGDML
mgnify:CR=1 FL=1|tara:strand:+ start:756 stop:1448 length:693 start_codon:yes stop_codon:yes gene_type:complete